MNNFLPIDYESIKKQALKQFVVHQIRNLLNKEANSKKLNWLIVPDQTILEKLLLF